jgi:lipoprotein NlpI
MNTSAIAVILIFGAAFLVMGIEIAHQKRTTGAVDMKAARRWFYRTVGAALVLLLGLALFDLADFGRARQALSDAEAGSAAAERHDLDMAITLYGKAIDAGTLNDAALGKVYKARGLAHLQKHEWDAAEQDLGEAAKHGAGDDAIFHFGLGVAHAGKGENDAALREFGSVIASVRDPENLRPAALAARGNIYVTLGQSDRGLRDYDDALRRTPDDTEMRGARGNAYFYLGQYDKAEADLTAASNGDPKMAYYPLWLYLAQRHQGKDGKAELEKRAAKLDLQAWPGPVAEFYRGRIAAADVLAAARSGDAKVQGDQQCEADFYLGEHALLGGDKDEARRLLGQAAADCDRRFIEYAGAKAELSRLAQ